MGMYRNINIRLTSEEKQRLEEIALKNERTMASQLRFWIKQEQQHATAEPVPQPGQQRTAVHPKAT